jgi:hypothetical protein
MNGWQVLNDLELSGPGPAPVPTQPDTLAVNCGVFFAKMAESETDQAGRYFYLLSKADIEGPLPALGNANAQEGWAFFNSISSNGAGLGLDTYIAQMLRVSKRMIREAGIEKQVKDALKKALSEITVSESILKNTTEKLINLLLDSSPIFFTAVFRLFGDLSLCTLHVTSTMLLYLTR